MAGTDLIEKKLNKLIESMDQLHKQRTEMAMVCGVRLLEYAGYASVQEDAPVRPVWLFTVAELIARRAQEATEQNEGSGSRDDEFAAITLLRMVQANDLSAPASAQRAPCTAADHVTGPEQAHPQMANDDEQQDFAEQDLQAMVAEDQPGSQPAWVRSFPGPAPHDPSWVLDVVEDLRAFSEHIGAEALCAAFDQTRGQVQRILKR